MKQKLILTMITISFLTIATMGQSIKVGVGGGYTALTGDNSLTPENLENLNSGFHYGGKLVVGIPLFPIQFTGNIYQNDLSNEYTDATSNLTVKSETSFRSIGLGAEMTLLPGPVQPYLAAEVLFTSFGETTVTVEGFDPITGDGADSETGLGLGAGVYFKLLPVVDLDLSAHYNMNTLLGSSDALNSTHIRLNILYSFL